MNVPVKVRQAACVALAGIRIFNGAAALFAPQFLLRQLGLDPANNPGGYYAFRMFGIRTILIGAELLFWGQAQRAHALRLALLIHLSDTLSAAYAGIRGQLPRDTAIKATAISAFNVLLALLAQEPQRMGTRLRAADQAAAGLALASIVTRQVRAADGHPRLTVTDLLGMSLAERDSAFRDGAVGEIPDGDAEGTVLVATEPLFLPARWTDRLAAMLARRLAWGGKVFDARKGELVNKVGPLQIHAVRAKVYKAPSWFDDCAAIILDYSKTSFIAKAIRDEIRLVGPGTYLGQVYWGPKRVLQFALEFPTRALRPPA